MKISYADGSVAHVDDTGAAHRDDGPAVLNADGSTEYFRHGVRHRTTGPAVEPAGEWWAHGHRVPRDEQPLCEHLLRTGQLRLLAAALERWQPSERLAELIDHVAETLPPEPVETSTRHSREETTGRFTWTPPSA